MPIGVLRDNDIGKPVFTYDPDYAMRANVIPLSQSLPLQTEPSAPGPTQAFFENLLQENDYLQRRLGTEALRGDVVGILERVGKDCPGALSCTPEGAPRPRRPGRLERDYIPIKDIEITVDDLAHRRMPRFDKEEKGDPSPLAGVQPKIAVTAQGDQLCLPIEGAPTTHILKVSPDDDRSQSLNELACLRMAKSLGITTVKAQRFDINGRACLLIDRYDRIIEDGAVHRLHQEDFAQALGLAPYQKYQRTSGAQFTQDASFALMARTRRPALSRLELLNLTLDNLLLGNLDNHAKNHALLYNQGTAPELAPAYDLVTTVLNPSNTDELSQAIGESKTFEALKRQDLIELARQSAKTDKQAETLLTRKAKTWSAKEFSSWAEVAVDGLPETLAEPLIAVWEKRRDHLLALLSGAEHS